MDLLYKNLFIELQKILPKKWSKIVFYIEYIGNSFSMKYFSRKSNGKYEDCYSINKSNINEMQQVFFNIHNIVYPSREKLPDDKKWTVMTFIVTNDLNFEVEYDYSNHLSKMIIWEEDWAKKYLN